MMRKKAILLLIMPALLLAACAESAKETQSSGSDDEFTAYADSLFQANVDSSMIAGATVLVARGDDILLKKAYGYADLEFDVPMPVDASFEIGSVTKQFTSAAILKLMEQGKLSLDDDITMYLDFDLQGREVSIRQLLNHTSGVFNVFEPGQLGKIIAGQDIGTLVE